MPSDTVYFAGGVYEAIPGRLAIGPMMHVKVLTQRPDGATFGSMTLGEKTSRYFVSCLPMAPSLPPLGTPSTPQTRHEDPSALTTGPVTPGASTSASPLPDTTTTAGQRDGMPDVPSRAGRNVADFLAKMKERQALARRPTSGTTSTSAPSTPAPSSAPTPAAPTATPPLTPAAEDASVVDQATTNATLKQMVTEQIGASHFCACNMSPDKLQTPQTTEAVEFIRKALREESGAFVYIFSGSGKNRASAVAIMYMLQVEKLSLQTVTTRLPLSTPRIPYMTELLEMEKARASTAGVTSDFAATAWFTKYFSIRYPDRDARAVRAALDSCNGDYVRADRILQEELFFSKSVAETTKRAVQLKAAAAASAAAEKADMNSQTFGGFEDHEQSRLSLFDGDFPVAAAAAAEPLSSAKRDSGTLNSGVYGSRGNGEMGSMSARQTPAILGMPNLVGFHADDIAAENPSVHSGSTDTGTPLPAAALSALDEDMIRTIVRGLRSCDVAATPEEVRESYLRHRRNKTRVLGDFLKSGADNTKLTNLAKALPTTVPSRTPRSSAADSSGYVSKGANGSFPRAVRYRSRESVPSPRPDVDVSARQETSPDPARPISDADECTASDIYDDDETITSTVEREKLQTYAFPSGS